MSVSRTAAQAIADEFNRRTDAKSGLIVDTSAGDSVLVAALDGLMPGDTLTLTAAPADLAGLTAFVDDQGAWVAGRVQVVGGLAEAESADVVMLARPVTESAEEFGELAAALRAKLNPGGVLCLAAGLTAPAREEIADLIADHGVASDLVLRSRPPLRVHRLRFGEAKPSLAEQILPARRPSSVRLTSTMHIDANGVAAGAICLGVAGLVRKARPGSKLWLVPAAAALPVASFFRDPQRPIDHRGVDDDPSAILASGDGQVLSVERVTDERFGAATGQAGDEWVRVAVFLSVFNVHVNRSPVAGRVVDVFRENGGYAPAMNPAAEHNVACYTVLDTARGRVAVAQRTGLVARRIVNRTKIGALLAKGERYGLIRFGSRTDVYLPADAADVAVAPGEKVIAGDTVIARWRK